MCASIHGGALRAPKDSVVPRRAVGACAGELSPGARLSDTAAGQPLGGALALENACVRLFGVHGMTFSFPSHRVVGNRN